MAASKSGGNVNAGEAGHGGHDRQPLKTAGTEVRTTAPEGADVAAPQQVQGRSDAAAAGLKGGHARKDQLDPGPNREEAEKSKGAVHHDQHEREQEMAKKVEKL